MMTSTKDRSLDRLTIQAFLQATLKYKHDLRLMVFMFVSSIGFTTALPFIVGLILSKLIEPNQNLTGYLIAFGVTAVITVLSNYLGYNAFLRLQPKVIKQLFNRCYDMLSHRGMSFHNNQVSGKTVTDAIDYPNAYTQLSNTVIIDIIPFALGIITGLGVIFYHSWLLGLIMLAMTAVAIGTGVSLRRRMAPHRKKRIAARQAMISHLADSIVNVQTIKTFATEDSEQQRHYQLADTLRQRQTHDWHIVAIDGSQRMAFLLGFQAIFIVAVIWLINRDPSLLAVGIFAFTYTITLANRLFAIGAMVRGIEEALLQAEPMTKALDEQSEIIDRPGAGELTANKGAIEFKAVGFHYADASADNAVFTNLDLTIEAGEKVGLVGPSGGGKSTITRLLLRFEDIQQGSITLDGQNIAAVTQQSLRRALAYVPQEPLLFHRSIAENIGYGKADATPNEIKHAAKQAAAHNFISRLPDGYDTIVGERGVKLSGGQRQRIAIARAMLKDSPIIVLDEATSALDSESEVAIQNALWKLMAGRTAIVVAHRLSTIQKMDRIIVIEDGTVIEQGSHKELLNQNGLYSRLWTHQSGGFIED